MNKTVIAAVLIAFFANPVLVLSQDNPAYNLAAMMQFGRKNLPEKNNTEIGALKKELAELENQVRDAEFPDKELRHEVYQRMANVSQAVLEYEKLLALKDKLTQQIEGLRREYAVSALYSGSLEFTIRRVSRESSNYQDAIKNQQHGIEQKTRVLNIAMLMKSNLEREYTEVATWSHEQKVDYAQQQALATLESLEYGINFYKNLLAQTNDTLQASTKQAIIAEAERIALLDHCAPLQKTLEAQERATILYPAPTNAEALSLYNQLDGLGNAPVPHSISDECLQDAITIALQEENQKVLMLLLAERDQRKKSTLLLTAKLLGGGLLGAATGIAAKYFWSK